MAYENYNIRQFMSALFNADRSVMDEQELKVVHTEYIDTSGLYDVEEFEKVTYIHFLNNRVNSIAIALRLQRDFVNNFEMAYLPGLRFFEKFGHKVYWKNKEEFLDALIRLELKEKKYISQLEKNMKELIDKRAKKNSKEQTVKQTRGSFIRTINSLGKLGYKVDMDKTTVEELAYMIKAQTEENTRQ